MIVRRFVVPVLAAILVGGACGGDPPPPPPPPPGPDMDSLRAYQDSVRAAEEARLRAAEEARRVQALLEQTVFFDYDRADLRQDTRTALDSKVPVLRERAAVRLRIEGHADERGSTEYNLALGMRRAVTVKDYLSGFGVDPSRLETVSYGEERPRSAGHTEAAWAQNRRAEFIVTSGSPVTAPEER